MRRIPWIAALGTIGLALPFAAAAVFGAGYLVDHALEIQVAVDWQALGEEARLRAPELAGMLVGLAVILLLLLVRPRLAEHPGV